MDVSTMKTPQLPLDFSLNVKAEGVTNLNIHVKAAENGASMLISPEKNSHSAFRVVTPKHADGKCDFAAGTIPTIGFLYRKFMIFVLLKFGKILFFVTKNTIKK